MHVVVTGSQGWRDNALIRAVMDTLPERSVVIVGGARGADQVAEGAARLRGHTVIVERPDWSVKPDTPPGRIRRRRDGTEFDAAAGMVRTNVMLDRLDHLPDEERRVLAFWLGSSPGTRHGIREAMRRGYPLDVYWRPEAAVG